MPATLRGSAAGLKSRRIQRHRKARRFITCVVNVMHLENFRAKLVYHPRVLQLIEQDERCWIKTKAKPLSAGRALRS